MKPRRTLIKIGVATLAFALLVIFIQQNYFADNKGDANDLMARGAFNDGVVINEILKKDVVCLIPTGMYAFGYLEQNFKEKKPDRSPSYDSEAYWYLIAIDDGSPIAQIREIDRYTIQLDLDVPVCSRNLKIRREISPGRVPILKVVPQP